jgi:DNA-binding NtrC family response regulator
MISGEANLDKILKRFITVNPEMLGMLNRVRRLALIRDPVLIQGATGTGKEIIAEALSAVTGSFNPMNCAAFTETLIDSDLFGHDKGAYTDAKKARDGALIAAGSGTVYFDEIDKMSKHGQAKLLRAIEDHTVRPLGTNTYIDISCRFVASSKVDLGKLVDDGRFLEDLYARLSTFEIHISPLIDRPEDIDPILESLLVPREYRKLSDYWMKRVDRFNVRALLQVAANYRVFKTV